MENEFNFEEMLRKMFLYYMVKEAENIVAVEKLSKNVSDVESLEHNDDIKSMIIDHVDTIVNQSMGTAQDAVADLEWQITQKVQDISDQWISGQEYV